MMIFVLVIEVYLNHLKKKKNNNQYIEGLKKDGCYGMHICTGLWRKNKL